MKFRTIGECDFEAPILFAAWPGMGNVGVAAAEYVCRKLGAKAKAEMDVVPLVVPDAIDVRDGLGAIPSPPAQVLHYVAEPRAMVFTGEAQIGGRGGVALANELLRYAQEHGVKTVYTGAAFATSVSFRDEAKVYGVATDDELKARFPAYGVEPLSEGRISGLNGLLMGLAGARGLSAACFLASMPQYAINTPNPRASRALVGVFERILNTGIDLAEIDEEVERVDRLLAEFESKVNEALENLRVQLPSGSPEQTEESSQQPEPHEVTARIEELFQLARGDRSKASLLKQELDRWGLFKLYEDRFLDLFSRTEDDSPENV